MLFHLIGFKVLSVGYAVPYPFFPVQKWEIIFHLPEIGQNPRDISKTESFSPKRSSSAGSKSFVSKTSSGGRLLL
jgi:hypothetical protein